MPALDRDLKRIRDATLRQRVSQTIEALEAAARISDVPGVLKESSHARGHYYRIRIGDYRLGIAP